MSNVRFFLVLFFMFSGFLHGFSASYRQKFDSVVEELRKQSFVNDSEARILVKQMSEIASEHLYLLPLSLYWESFVNYAQGKFDVQINSKICSHLKIFNEKDYPFENALLYHSLALNDAIIGNYTDCFTSALKALSIYKQTNNILFVSRVEQLLGVICFRTRNYEMSEKFSRQSLSKTVPKSEYYKSLINMYIARAFINGQLSKSINEIVKLAPAVEKMNDLALSVVLYHNIGGLYALEGKTDLAHGYYNKAFEVDAHIENNSIAISLLINAGSYAMGIKDYQTAENHMKKAEKLALEINNAEQLSSVYYGTFQLYEKIGNSEKAFAYLKKYNQQKEKILSNSQTIDSYQAYVSTFLASAEKEMMISKQKALLEKRRFIITLISSVFIAFLAAALFIIFYQKKRQQTKKLLYEKAIQTLQEEKHKEILSIKTREVTSYSLMLSSKNDVLEDILQKTKELSNSDKADYSNIIEVVKKV